MIAESVLHNVGEAARQDARVGSLRAAFPELHFSECSEDDVSPRYRPALDVGAHTLYYITGATGHCLEITNDAGVATGILIAAKVDDE